IRLTEFQSDRSKSLGGVRSNTNAVNVKNGLYSVFFPLKMTGLDLDKDQIIEMACIITDCELNIIAEGPTMIINQPDELLDRMSDWCKEHHGKSEVCRCYITLTFGRTPQTGQRWHE
uniref:Exonuclease domain-containing protein n=1 Tax=Fundulus heteroclitus TaxID=8078 RepID=A0A3Q2TUH5_FUNHE